MSRAQTPTETAYGYSPPSVTHFSVFLPNKVGKLSDLVEILDRSHIMICAISVNEASDHAVVRIITSNAQATRDTLQREKLAFTELAVLVLELSGKHTLSSMCLTLLRAELSIHFAYPLMLGNASGTRIALAVDDVTLAGQILRRKEFRLLGEADLANPI
jgi:hypothetical protein